MYYVIENTHTNNESKSYIEIATSPAIYNMSGETCLSGWAGTTNDWAVYAHGSYATIEAARTAIIEQFGEVRGTDSNGEAFAPTHDDCVEVYHAGKYAPMDQNESTDWVYPAMAIDVTIATSNEKIAELAALYEEQANDEGYTLSGVADIIEKYRAEKREEIEAEEFNDDAEVIDVFGQGSSTPTKEGVDGYQVDFAVEIGDKAFRVVFQSADRSDKIMAYNGYEMRRAAAYGCDSDESEELLEFLEHDDSFINYLEERAEQLCKEWLEDQQ